MPPQRQQMTKADEVDSGYGKKWKEGTREADLSGRGFFVVWWRPGNEFTLRRAMGDNGRAAQQSAPRKVATNTAIS